MNANEQLITSFYDAFNKKDAAGMVACYHPKVVFWDPVFLTLEGPRAGAMWTMLCARAADLSIEACEIASEGSTGSAHWDARYTFSATGRKVLNRIDAAFEFQDGKISKHTDSFSLYRWACQALGPTGVFLGWTPLVKNKIRGQAKAGLEAWLAKNPS